ncbi:MAG: diguanylate cyclase, partial [Nocardioides sp.]
MAIRPGPDEDYGFLLAELRFGEERLREAEVRFKLIVETIPGAAYIAEPGENGAWIYISPRLEELLGYAADEWIAQPKLWIGLIHPDDRQYVLEDEDTWTETTGGMHIGEYRLKARDGSYRWIRDAATARPGDRPGDKALWFGVLSDITASRENEEALRESQQLLQAVLETAQDAFVAVDSAGNVLEWNRRAETMFGRCRETVLGHQLTELVVPERLRPLSPLSLASLDATRSADLSGVTLELTAMRANGAEFPVELSLWSTRSGPSHRYNAFIRDITEQKRLQNELHDMAFRDALTSLPNRALFCERLDAALAEADPETTQAVLFLDVDDFKVVNDSLGHAAGDHLLSITADRLRACVRPGDTVARIAGDEFAVLLPEVAALEDAWAVADRIRRALAEPVVVGGCATTNSASIGIAASTAERRLSAAGLLQESDAAMYHAKRSGKNVCVVFEPGIHATSVARMALRADLAAAMGRGELFLLFQPYFDLGDGSLVG